MDLSTLPAQGQDTDTDKQAENSTPDLRGTRRARKAGLFALDGSADDDDETEQGPPMLMIHASHFAVGWEGDQPYVNSAIPSEPNDTDGRGVFVKLSDPVYRCGGKVFRATFHWIGSPQGRQEEKEEVMDVMLCLKGKCNVCDPHMSDVPRNRDVDGKPFVHASCVEFGAAHGSHTYNVFKPAAGLKNDYARQFPVTRGAEVVFHDGQLRDVLVCVPELCAFCRLVEGGKKEGKAVLLKGEKSMAKMEKSYGPKW